MKKKFTQILYLIIIQLAFVNGAYATDSGMPWEGPLNKILDSISGPVVQVIATISIILAGLGLAFGEGGGGTKKILMIVIGIAIATLATSILSTLFGFSGGLII